MSQNSNLLIGVKIFERRLFCVGVENSRNQPRLRRFGVSHCVKLLPEIVRSRLMNLGRRFDSFVARIHIDDNPLNNPGARRLHAQGADRHSAAQSVLEGHSFPSTTAASQTNYRLLRGFAGACVKLPLEKLFFIQIGVQVAALLRSFELTLDGGSLCKGRSLPRSGEGARSKLGASLGWGLPRGWFVISLVGHDASLTGLC